MDARRPLHLPRLPRVRDPDRGRRGRARLGRGDRSRHPPRQGGAAALAQLLAADAGGAQARAREDPAQPDQGELAGDRAPAGLSRLRRREAVRRSGRGEVGAPLPRPLHPHRLQRQPVGDPAAAAEGPERARSLRPPARQPRPQGDDRDPRDVPAGRAVPDQSGRAARDRARHPPPRRAPPRPALRPPRRVRPLPLLPGLHPARALQHREPAQDPGDPAGGVRRRERRLHDPHLRVGAGPAALRRLHRARLGARLRRGGDRGAPRSSHARVDGRPPRRPRRPRR